MLLVVTVAGAQRAAQIWPEGSFGYQSAFPCWPPGPFSIAATSSRRRDPIVYIPLLESRTPGPTRGRSVDAVAWPAATAPCRTKPASGHPWCPGEIVRRCGRVPVVPIPRDVAALPASGSGQPYNGRFQWLFRLLAGAAPSLP